MSENIKYRQLKAFTVLVEAGSFVAAADQMAVTQPSLSALIKELERDIDVVLFDRSTRACTPTEAGKTFYKEIKGSLEQMEEAYRHVKDVGKGRRGKLRIASLSSLAAGVVTPKLAEFHRLYPNILVTLCERTHDQVHEAVRHGEVDLGIGSPLHSDPDLVFSQTFKDRLMVVVPKGHPLVGKARRTWKELNQFQLVMVRPGPATAALKLSFVQKVPAFEVEQAATALAMVRNGMGITVLPSSIAPALGLDGLECLLMPGALAVRRLGIIRRRNVQLSPAATAFTELMLGRRQAS